MGFGERIITAVLNRNAPWTALTGEWQEGHLRKPAGRPIPNRMQPHLIAVSQAFCVVFIESDPAVRRFYRRATNYDDFA
jgi:hypothetical protein